MKSTALNNLKNNMVMMKRLLLILIVLATVLGCTGGSSREREIEEDFHTGTLGVTMNFVQNSPPSKVYEGDHLGISVELWNKGVKMVTTYAGSPKNILSAISLIESKQIDVTPLITHILPLEKAAEGFALVAAAQDSIKVILEP